MSIAESRTQSTIPFLPVSRVSVKMAPSKSGGDVLNNWSQWQKNGSRSAEVEVSLMEMIAHDVLPLRTIEKPGFLNFLKILAPKLRIHKRYHFTNTLLPNLVNRLENDIKGALKNMVYVGITCDGWNSTDGKHSLLSVTGHWLDSRTFEPKYAILGSCAVRGRHTSENFCNIVEASLDKFEISKHSVVSVVRDGGSNVEAMCNKLELKSIHCYAHLIQLCVKDTLDLILEVEPIVLKVKKYCRKVHKSTVCREIFQSLQIQENLPERMLKKSCEVRWS
ncbi:hypothetical protein GCK72_012976 [Caenorhabditis remanei]|uniref:DUF659 domain-containing protein n=1 Tax=Caenorhabditis remanei TaxID=31234 RepID=A0A6A5GPL3_CAERE|nr:hypothetical protein GCK72_012976 [Caenorhabditis remanei]KAF1756523.1 hypothetical protein GCK72_012976 [Caenorhabditis remanei]